MPNQNDFLAFATGSGANVMSQAAWAALAARQSGFADGTADTAQVNKAWRQAGAMTAAVGAFIAGRGPLSAFDDGDIGDLELAIASAFARFGNMAGFANATGVVNNLAVNLDPTPIAYYEGLEVCFVPNSANTGEAFLSLNGIGNRPIVRRDGSTLQPADLLAGAPYVARFIGSASNGVFRLVGFAAGETIRVVPEPILWVRPNGSDNNRGASNSDGQAFQTIGGAVTYAANYLALNAQPLVVKMGAAGTYQLPNFVLPSVNSIRIEGDQANQGGFVCQGGGFAGAGGILNATLGTGLTLRGLTLRNTGNSASTLASVSNATVRCEYVTFSNVGGLNAPVITAAAGGFVTTREGCIVDAGASILFDADGGRINQNSAIQLVGALNFSTAFARCINGRITAAPGFTGTGTVTGKRFDVIENGVISVNGQGVNWLPGSIAGTSGSGGQYV